MTERNLRKTRVGKVVSTKMDKTIVVAIEDNVRHPKYGKILKRTVKLHAHDAENVANVGDKVSVMGCSGRTRRSSFFVIAHLHLVWNLNDRLVKADRAMLAWTPMWVGGP